METTKNDGNFQFKSCRQANHSGRLCPTAFAEKAAETEKIKNIKKIGRLKIKLYFCTNTFNRTQKTHTTLESILNHRPALEHEINQVAEVAGYLWQNGWAERNGGNITVNITHLVDDAMRALPAIGETREIGTELSALKGCYFYCKGTGKRMRDLAREPMSNGSIIRILDDCRRYEIVADEAVAPTSELPSHLMVHNHLMATGSPYRATLHTHPIELVAMSHTEKFLKKDVLTRLLWSMIPETKAFCPRGLGIVRYQLPGSLVLAEQTLAQLDDYDVVMWEKHGVFAQGLDIMDAFDQVDVLSKSARIYIASRQMGFEPDGMSDAQMEEMKVAFNLPK